MKNQEKIEIKNIFNELKKGNKNAIEELYKKYNKMVYGIAFSILKNKEDSEDIVQTVFQKLYTIDKDKMPKDKEATWLYAVTKNETLLLLRNKKDAYDIEKIYNIANEDNEINKLIDRESYNQLINKLDSKEKEVVSLKIISNLSFSQISELLGEPVGTVKWRYYKSIYALKIMLSNFGMFVVTFVLGIATFKQTKKSSNAEIKQEASDDPVQDKENIYDDTESNKSEDLKEEILTDEEIHQDIIVEEPIINNNVNYLGYGIMGVSSIFLTLTIIFAIILKKHQLNSRKNHLNNKKVKGG